MQVDGKVRSLTTTHWEIFMLIYRHRGDVVSNDCIRAELSQGSDQPSTHLITEHMRLLRKVLAGSRYQILNYRSLGYELVVADDAASVRPTRGVTTTPRLDGEALKQLQALLTAAALICLSVF